MTSKAKMKKHSRSNRSYLVPAAVLIVIGLFFRFCLSGYRFTAECFWAAAAVVLVFFALWKLERKAPKLAKTFNKIASYGLILFLMVYAITLFSVIGESGNKVPEDTKVDTLLVLGAGVNGKVPSASLTWRLEAVLDAMEKYPGATAILCGGQGAGEDISEALCMRLWLVARGVDESRLILEEQSTSTVENVRNAMVILENTGRDPGTIGLVTSEYHMLRARFLASREGVDTVPIPAKTVYLVLRFNYYLREVPALWVNWIFG